MLLSDGEIQLALESGELIVDPSPPSSSLQPASIDLILDAIIRVQNQEPPESLWTRRNWTSTVTSITILMK